MREYAPSDRMIRSEAFRAAAEAVPLACMLELGLIVLSIVCFVILDLYVLGCEKV